MKVELSLFGVFRSFDPEARIVLEVDDGARIGDLRRALQRHAEGHWSGFKPSLLSSSAFASEQSVLRDGEAVPANGRLAILPPVSGG